MSEVSTYIARQNDEIVCLLLYRRNGRQIRVLNEGIELPHADIEQFSRTMFIRHSGVDCIVFNAIRASLRPMPYPVQQYYWTDDIVAELPDTVDGYLARLSKNMRQSTKYYVNRVRRLHPSFRFQVFSGDGINERMVREIYQFNRRRMESKQVVPNVPDEEVSRILALSRRRGFVMVATINDQVCGGLVFWRVGDDVYLRSIAHDPQYDDINLGTVCCHLGMMECINIGARRFHFLWGRMPYKYRFLGEDRAFDRIVLYRNRVSLVRQAVTAFLTMKAGLSNELDIWLAGAENREDAKSRAALRLLRAWRLCKKLKTKLIRR